MLSDDNTTAGAVSSTTPADDILQEIIRLGGAVPTDRPEPLEEVEDSGDWVERELAYARLVAFQSHHGSKKQWSSFMIAAMAALIAFQMVLLSMVGFGWWDFTPYDWLLPILLVQNFAQIVGLAIVIVKALFSSFKE